MHRARRRKLRVILTCRPYSKSQGFHESPIRLQPKRLEFYVTGVVPKTPSSSESPGRGSFRYDKSLCTSPAPRPRRTPDKQLIPAFLLLIRLSVGPRPRGD